MLAVSVRREELLGGATTPLVAAAVPVPVWVLVAEPLVEKILVAEPLVEKIFGR